MNALKSAFLRNLLRPMLPAFAALALFSFVNTLLMLVPSVYMLQISERVMVSRNETTLLFLTGIAIFLLGVMAAVDAIRYRVLRRVATALDDQIGERVFVKVRQQFGSSEVTQLVLEYELTKVLRLSTSIAQGGDTSRAIGQRTERGGADLVFVLKY